MKIVLNLPPCMTFSLCRPSIMLDERFEIYPKLTNGFRQPISRFLSVICRMSGNEISCLGLKPLDPVPRLKSLVCSGFLHYMYLTPPFPAMRLGGQCHGSYDRIHRTPSSLRSPAACEENLSHVIVECSTQSLVERIPTRDRIHERLLA